MTESEQFATEFLGVQPESFPVHINLKITGELLDAYLAHLEKKKVDPTPKPFKYDNGYGLSTNSATQELHRRANAELGKFAENTITAEVSATNNTQHQYGEIKVEPPSATMEFVNNGIRVRTLVWDWKNNCYEPENKNK